jgi:hypothetical protein
MYTQEFGKLQQKYFNSAPLILVINALFQYKIIGIFF